MGLKPSEKGKKSEGLAVLLRQDDPHERPTSSASDKVEELNSALRYVLNLDRNYVLVEGGSIVYRAVEEALQQRTAQLATQETPLPPEGRLGPEHVELDVDSKFGLLVISEENRFGVESKGNFSSCRATHCFYAGRWMYEAVLGTGGIQQIGWATLSCVFNREEGVGDGEDSYAFDGKRVKKWSMDAANYGQAWAPGDVIGCCADFDDGELVFYRNGKSMGTAFRDVRTLKPELGYFPAISLSEDERCTLNFGTQPFYFPIEGYHPCETPPSNGEQSLVAYLTECLERLIEMTMAATNGISATSVIPCSKLTVDEGVLMGALIVQHLRPFLRNPFHIQQGIVPSLKRLLGDKCMESTRAVCLFMDHLANALGPTEFCALTETLLTHIADSCAVMPFRASELPYTASYPYLSLFVALLRSPVVTKVFFASDRAFALLERCLVRKQPTTDDLKELLPNVWWKGCKDETMSEDIMRSLVFTLSTAYQKIEQLQFELLMIVVSKDVERKDRLLRKPTNVFLNFLRYLLEKNAGAARNIPPPGLSGNQESSCPSSRNECG